MSERLGLAAVALCLACGLLAGCARGPVPEANLAARTTPVDETQAQAMVSEYRRAHGLSGVALDPVLEKAASAQALAMARANILSHTVAGSLEQRLASVGAPPAAADENVSGGYDTLDAAIAGWRKSPPHNANLLDTKMRRMGIGSAYAAQSRYKRYWSLILAD